MKRPSPPFGPDFHGGEVGRRQHVPVRLSEGDPCYGARAIQRRLNAVGLRYIAVDDPVADILQRILDAIVSPAWVLLRQSQNHIHHNLSDT